MKNRFACISMKNRNKLDVICKRCQGEDHYCFKDKWSYECKSYKFRTSLRNDTIMQNSNLTFLVLVSCYVFNEYHHKVFLPKRFKDNWALTVMNLFKLWFSYASQGYGKRNKRYALEDIIEIDKGYFTVE